MDLCKRFLTKKPPKGSFFQKAPQACRPMNALFKENSVKNQNFKKWTFWVKNFSKSDMCLKRSPRQGFSIPNNRFLIGVLQTSKFSIFSKSALSAILQGKCTSKVQNNTASSDRAISKNHYYEVLTLLKQIIFHIVVMKIGLELKKIETREKNSRFFFHLWVKSLLFTLHIFIQVSVNR